MWLSLQPTKVFATKDFSTSFDSTYEIGENISTKVVHQISLTNLKPNSYASEFTLIIGSTNLDSITARDNSGLLPVAINQKDNGVAVSVNLKSRPALGLNQKKEFTIRYDSRDTAQKVGKIIEVNIPKLSNSKEFDSFTTNLLVPAKFGSPSLMVPEPAAKTPTAQYLSFTFDRNDETGISAVFGTTQSFSVFLKYFISNPGGNQIQSSIALPPDTAYQRVSIDRIKPLPIKLEADIDGNWLAFYQLKPQQKLSIEADLTVEIKMVPLGQNFPQPLPEHLQPSVFWQSDDPEILALAVKLKTPKEIYDYVVSNLTYDYTRAEKRNERKGAKSALKNPGSAICTEFTDLFIALSRAAGIPARELEGFAWTENPKLRPLSLSGDILHAWPEYWDKDRNLWVQVDPTWGNTTGLIDYFTKLDFNHIVFAIHGKSDTTPLPAGFYKTDESQKKTVAVTPKNVSLDFTQEPEAQIFIPNTLPTYLFNRISVMLTNQQSYAQYKIPVSILVPGAEVKINSPSETNLLPWETKSLEFKIKPRDLWMNKPLPITVRIGLKTYEYQPKAVSPLKPIIGIFIGSAAIFAVILALRSGNIRLPGFLRNSHLYREIKKS
ncbi:transglutaminase domain-containing protein [Candidatus Collierbacteria bacterium]|nr:transglutaminase domain-containing protein [Candidatus Collierbacteria bacterium]